ncbi:transporter [Klebsiella variicola]|nr:transporter [Klebsiella variicola]
MPLCLTCTSPAGSYDAGRTLNVGENRWKFDLQLGGVQQLGNGFATQLSTDVMWYGVNDDASGIGTGRLKQDNTYQFQGWVTWTPPADKSWTLAAGYSQYWGGKQQLDGIENRTGDARRSGQAGIIEIRHPHGAGTGSAPARPQRRWRF